LTTGAQSGPEPAIDRRRPLAALAVALALAAVLAALLSGGDGGPAPRRAGAAPHAGAGTQPPSGLAALPPPVQRLAARLPLSSQVAQLFLVDFAGTKQSSALSAALRGHGWGGVLFTRDNFADPHQSAGLTRVVRAEAHAAHPLPALLAADQPGGPATAFPTLPPQSEPRVGASGRPALAEREALTAGQALRRLGIALTLAPQADVDVPAGAVSAESFSGDPAHATAFTAAAVDGYRRARIKAAVGHFPGEGAASQDPDLAVGTVGQSLPELRTRDEQPFAAVAPRVPAVVMSNAIYAAWDGVTPATLLPEAVAELRGRLGFHGLIISDDLGAAVLATGGTVGEAAVQALKAGVDLLYVSGGPRTQELAYRAVLKAARRGDIPAARLTGALGRVLGMKVDAGVVPSGQRVRRPRAAARSRPRRRSP
jgi:beta-N-acetylhexosaminidase